MRSASAAIAVLGLGLVTGCPKADESQEKAGSRTGPKGATLDDAHQILESTLDPALTADRVRSVLAGNPSDRRAEAFLGALRALADGRLQQFSDLKPEFFAPPESERVRGPGTAFVFHPAATFEESGRGTDATLTHLLPIGLPVRVLEVEGPRARVEISSWLPRSSSPDEPARWSLGEWSGLEDPTARLMRQLLGGPPERASAPRDASKPRVGLVPLHMLGTTTVSLGRLTAEAERSSGTAEERALRLARYTAVEPRDRGKQRELLKVALEAGLYSLALVAADDLRLLSDPAQPFEWSMVIDHHAFCRGKLERSSTEWFDRVPELRPFPSAVHEVKRTSELAGRFLTEPQFDAASRSHGTDKDLCLVDAVLGLGAGEPLRVVGDSFYSSRCGVPEIDREGVLRCVETKLGQIDEDTPPEIVAETRRLLETARGGEGELSFLSWQWALREFPPDEVQDLEAVLNCLPGPRAASRDAKGPSGLVDGDSLEGRTKRWLEETRRRFPSEDLLRMSLTNRRVLPASPGRESLLYRFSGSTCECESAPTAVEFRRLPSFVVAPRSTLELLLRVERPIGAGLELAATFDQAVRAIEALALPEGGSSDPEVVRACLTYDRGCERPLPESSFARRFAPTRACCCP